MLDHAHDIGGLSEPAILVSRSAALRSSVERAFATENEVHALVLPAVRVAVVAFGRG
jgi:hypothetical protein